MYEHKTGIFYRKIHMGDLHALLKLKEESWWGTHQTSIINIEDQRKWYENLGNTLVMIGEKKKIDDHNSKVKVAGHAAATGIGIGIYSDIDWIGRTCNVSGSAFKDQRKDHDTIKDFFSTGVDFAFEVLNLERVGAEVLETHAAAHKLEVGYLKFQIEGRRRKAVYKSGVYYDSIQLGLLREDWNDCERVKELRGETGCCNENFDHVKAERFVERFNRDFSIPSLSESNGRLP